jgi:hypothetical protein
MVASFTAVATFLVMLLLVWLAARRRINWVRWPLKATSISIAIQMIGFHIHLDERSL